MIIYRKGSGAICPKCRRKAPVVSSPKVKEYEDKIRYHLCNCGKKFMSIEKIYDNNNKGLIVADIERKINEIRNLLSLL